MERRPPKATDQEEIQKAFLILKECMQLNHQIEPTLWVGAFWSILVDGYNSCGVSYDEFTKEWDRFKHHYKPWFDE